MELQTDFNVGEYVYFMRDNKVWYGVINSIRIDISNALIKTESYNVSSDSPYFFADWIWRSDLFKTKEELFKQI